MTRQTYDEIDSELDLVLTREIDVPRELVWKAWTEPEQIKQWFTPKPWQTPECEIHLRPGGLFRTLMRGPAGEEFDNSGCYLEIVPGEKLVWTTALAPGYRPQVKDPGHGFGFFTAVITMQDAEVNGARGTRYGARAIHSNDADRKAHEEMGFHDGWGKALDQLVAMVKGK